jgi:hypothetical protein
MSRHPISPIEILAELVVALQQHDPNAINQRLDHLELTELIELNQVVSYIQICVQQRLWLRASTPVGKHGDGLHDRISGYREGYPSRG